ncbi:MAG: NAD-dependent dihydropyrimidine dehydrogenase subunit PreA [Oscillospiraceae bacterium]
MQRKLVISEEASRCLLCENPVCTKACPKGLDPARAVRAVRFENTENAGSFINCVSCKDCDAPCQKACVHYDQPIRIKEIAKELCKTENKICDLSIDFCGVHCQNPFFLSSSIVASNYEMCARAFEMGWAGMAFKTIGFYKPDEVSPRFDATSSGNRKFLGFKNLEQISEHTVDENMAVLKKLKTNYPDKVIISSIMGQNEEEWTELARLSQEAGADIIECNFSCPHMSAHGLGSDVGQNPELVSLYTKAVRKGTTLPILAKMTPNIGNMEIPAIAAYQSGATGIAAINTIKSITSINTDNMVSEPEINGKCSVSGYSGKAVKPIALRFVHDLAKCEKLKDVPISGMGGIETWHDALEFITLGCSNVQITTSVMEYGYRIIDDLISGLSSYMIKNNIKTLSSLVGVALKNFCSADELDRSTIVYPAFNKEKCIGCGRCYISCRDAGHQAISFDEHTREIRLNGKKCEGCQLCSLVCPANAIGISKRVSKQ